MSFIIHKVANPNAPVLTPRAPVTPNFSLIKNTVITKALRGMPNKFIITPRCESGTYLLRKVPMDGKYIPTQASNKKNAADRPPKIAIGEVKVEAVDFIVAIVAHAIDMVARESIPAVKFSAFTDILLTSCPNAVDPKRQHVIKQVKIVPYGVSAPGNAFPMTEVIAGGHCKTKIYIAASNNACTAPTSMILESDFTTLTASLIVGFEDSSFSSPSSLPDDDATFSFHKSEVNSAPAARKTVESSNGPVGPFFAAARPDNFPANIATMESPA